MHIIFDLVSHTDESERDMAPSPATDAVTRMELLDASGSGSGRSSSLAVESSSASGGDSGNSPSAALLEDFLPVLKRFSQSMGQLRCDAANDIIMTFRGKRKRHKSGDSSCQILISSCLSLCGLEQHYYSFNFVRIRGQARKEADLLTLYEQTRAKISGIPLDSKLTLCGSGIRSLLIDIINTRIKLINIYDTLIALEDWGHVSKLHELIDDLLFFKEILEDLVQHTYLSDLVWLIYSEVVILSLLLNVQLQLIAGQYLPALLNLKDANEKIRAWFNAVHYGKLRSRSASFLRLGISKGQPMHLCGFVDQIYAILFAKFSLYFYCNVGPYCLRTDFEQALNDIGQPNFFQLCTTFFRKHDALYVAFVSSDPNFGGCVCDTKQPSWAIMAAPNGDSKRLFKVLYRIGSDRKIFCRLLGPALDIIVENDMSEKEVLAMHDRSTVHSYLMALVEGSIYMVIITTKNVRGNDGKYLTFMSDICKTLTFTKLCQSPVE